MIARLHSTLTIAVCLCLGLLPSVHISALNAITLCIVLSALLDWRQFRSQLRLGWPHWVLLAFILYNLINALAYDTLSGNRPHYARVALETWSITLLVFFAATAFSHGRALKPALITWLPVGLLISFAIMSAFFFSGIEGHRPNAFSPSALYPPMWFLILTGVSFCWFDSMSQPQKMLRLGLLALAGVMTIYGGARLILIAWVLLSIYLLYYITTTHARLSHLSGPRRLALILGGVSLALLLASMLDILINGAWALTYRFTGALRAALEQNADFLRPQLWAESWRWIQQSPWIGHGVANERFLLREIGPDHWWYRAHQTYLSFWIGGGIIGLISGIFFQLTALGLIWPRLTRALAPAAFALLGVTFLNGLTDSIFQSFFIVQVYMLIVVLLHSQKTTRGHTA